MSDKIYVGQRISDFDYGDKLSPITRVNLNVDSNVMYTAGDDTGRTLECTCPWGTQEMADSILAEVGAVDYQPYAASDAIVEPAAELGDVVEVGGVRSVLANLSTNMGRTSFSAISAPGLDEIDDEYPYQTKQEREIKRNLATTRSLITKTAEQIRLEVFSEIDDLSSSFELALDSISAQVTDNANSIAALDMFADSITLSVSNGSTSSTIKLLAGSAEIASETISMSGLVTYTGLESGTTTINGGCIKTGTIDVERLNLTGSITWADLATDAQSQVSSAQSTADMAYNTAYNAYSLASSANSTVSGWQYGGTTYIDGAMLMTGTVKASSLQAGSVALLGSSGLTAGSMTLTGASSYTGQKVVLSSGGIEISASYGDVFVQGGSGSYLQLSSSGVIAGAGNLISNGNGSYSCGDSSHKWSAVYASSGTIQTSDRNAKHDIEELPEKYLDMLLELPAYRFKLNDGTSGRYHVGYIAQDVEEYMAKHEIDSLEFGGFVKDADEDGNDIYMLRYEEFIAIHTLAVQRIFKRLEMAGL